MSTPLGDYAQFHSWSGKPRVWGPDGAGWRVWFGGRVIDGLCGVLDEHLAAQRGREMSPAAIGCVPWLTSDLVVDRLLKLNACCIVVDKGASLHALSEMNSRSGFPNGAISQLEDLMPADVNGSAPMTIDNPYTEDATWHEIAGVRVAGWRRTGQKPLAHAKMLVLGEIGWVTYDTPYGAHEAFRFEPQRVWFGSANWTEASRNHLETGFVCDDPPLVAEAMSFIADMIAFSEPFDSPCVGPEPNLVRVSHDDDAMAQAAAEMDFDPEDYDEQ